MNSLTDKSILVIDDDAGMLRALDRVLRAEGATVTCANWAGDAMEILNRREKRIDLVITDLRMPFVNGLTVVYAIHVIFPKLPVIVLTAFATPEVTAACHDEGAVALLEKPLDSEELINAVRAALNLESPVFGSEPEPGRESEGRSHSRKLKATTDASPEMKNK